MNDLTLTGAAPRAGVTITKWRALRSGSLRGFADVFIPSFKLTIADCPVNESHGTKWAGLPGKVQVGKDGEIIRKATGKPAYTPMGSWADARVRNAFSDAVVEAVLAFDPGAFDE